MLWDKVQCPTSLHGMTSKFLYVLSPSISTHIPFTLSVTQHYSLFLNHPFSSHVLGRHVPSEPGMLILDFAIW